MNLNQRIAGYGRKLSKTERLLVDEMLARYPQSLLESATALAGGGHQRSTVVRLLAKLGYDSYAQAQTEARAEVTARLASPGERADAMGADGHGARACLHARCCMTSIICRRPSPRWIRRCSRPRCARRNARRACVLG